MPSIIQFFHPGGERKYDFLNKDKQYIRKWNDHRNHYRKYMLHEGSYIENNVEKKGEMFFWGEWEPPSIVELLPHNGKEAANKEYPKYLHSPFLPSINVIKEHQKIPDRKSVV